MNWETALHDPIYRTFAAICLGLLAVGGVLLGLLRVRLGRVPSSAWQSYRGWLVMVPIFLLVVFFGRGTTIAFLTLVAFAAYREFVRGTGLYRNWWMTGTAALGILAVAATVAVGDPTYHRPGWFGMFLALPIFVVALIFIVPIFLDRTKGQLQAMALATISFIYVGWMFGHLAFLVNSPHAYGYLMFLVLAVEANDIAAYVSGKLLGRRLLRPNISPNKTVAGSLGAIAVSMALPFVCRFALPHFTNAELVLTGLIVGIGGQLGDLSISVIKRDLGVKDMGALIPGHGGILDRIDSLIFVAPLFFHTIHYFHGIYQVR